MPAPPKPSKSTAEQRREAKRNRPRNPLKPTFGEDDRVVAPDPLEHERYRVQGSSLHSFSRRKLQQAQDRGIKLIGTFIPEPGKRSFARPIQRNGYTVRVVAQRTSFTLVKGQPLKRIGKRMKRLANVDRQQSAAIRDLPCICGCSIPVSWGHLETRAYESSRHDETLSVPVCDYVHSWLDQGKGRRCRTELLALARGLGRRLAHADVYGLLLSHGYYSDLEEIRRRER